LALVLLGLPAFLVVVRVLLPEEVHGERSALVEAAPQRIFFYLNGPWIGLIFPSMIGTNYDDGLARLKRLVEEGAV
jgi:hypothetical protein